MAEIEFFMDVEKNNKTFGPKKVYSVSGLVFFLNNLLHLHKDTLTPKHAQGHPNTGNCTGTD